MKTRTYPLCSTPEKGEERGNYLAAAVESRIVGGSPGYLSTMVTEKSDQTPENMRARIKRSNGL